MSTEIQRSFAGGEFSPALYARVDFTKYQIALRTLRNLFVLIHGGAANRPGTEFIGEVNDSTKAVRLIRFVFSVSQTYMLEFGDLYMRVIKDGAYITEAAQNITAITQANPGVVTITGHLYSNGDEVFITGIAGMTELNGRNFKVANVTANTFELQDMAGVNLDTTGFGAYVSGGTASKIFEIVTTYAEVDLATLNHAQSADIVTIVHPTYPPRELARTGDANWTLTDVVFEPGISRPPNGVASSIAAGSETFRWRVTAIKEDTYEQSVAGREVPTVISGATQADPVVITDTGHPYDDGDELFIEGVVGMTELNDRKFIIANSAANTYELEGEDGTGHTAYVSDGTSARTFIKATSAANPTSSNPHQLDWDEVTDAVEYNIYQEENGVYGLIGIAGSNTFNVTGVTPDLANTPPIERNPFEGTDNFPSTVNYYQQRLALANTNNNTEKTYFSRTANFKNFTISNPLQADDAVTITAAGKLVSEVRHLIDLRRLVILTESGEKVVNGAEAGVLSATAPPNIDNHTYNGSGALAPIVVGNNAIYLQARGSFIRDLAFDIAVDGYRGDDLTVASRHLFEGFTLVDWTFQQVPNSIIWIVRSDGVLLALTYSKEQQMFAWSRHDFEGGLVKNVASIPEGNEDVIYVTVERTIDGRLTKYVERLASRFVDPAVIADMTFMDSFLSLNGTNTDTGHTMTLSGGTEWDYEDTLTLTSSTGFFAAGDVGSQIHLTGSDGTLIRFTIDAFTSTTVVTGKPNKDVPVVMQATAIAIWGKAVDQVGGLWHLEGQEISALGDGFVAASPNNPSYTVVTVIDGVATFDQAYVVLHVGLPYISDLETLDIDTIDGETMSDKNKLITGLTAFVDKSRGMWVGSEPPTDDTVDPLEGLTEFKLRENENYDDPVELATGPRDINLEGRWNDNGRIFIRQIDPVPMTLLAVAPSGKVPRR